MAQGSKQHVMTDGLILRSYETVAETDRFVAILTRDRGLIRACAKGARKITNRHSAATQPLCYAKLSLVPAGEKYIVEDARPIEVFFPLRQSVEKLALAQYFCELALHLTPTDNGAEEHLRLLLNALYYLSEGSRAPLLVKAVVEGRLLCLEGYTPDLTACCHCGSTEGGQFWFDPQAGTVTCDSCSHGADAMAISSGVLTALRHVLYGEFDRCFAFTLPRDELQVFSTLMERFLLAQQPRRYTTLEFYHTLDT